MNVTTEMVMSDDFSVRRRAFLKTGLKAGAGAGAMMMGATGARAASDNSGTDFDYEIQLSDEAWRERLTEDQYIVIRKGITEIPGTSELWDNTAEGVYSCAGCELQIYDSEWKVELDIGYAFFRQSRENNLLMGIDGEPAYGGQTAMGEASQFGALIEVHCRRCGSHMGHLLTVEGETLHCINGTALLFEPTSA